MFNLLTIFVLNSVFGLTVGYVTDSVVAIWITMAGVSLSHTIGFWFGASRMIRDLEC